MLIQSLQSWMPYQVIKNGIVQCHKLCCFHVILPAWSCSGLNSDEEHGKSKVAPSCLGHYEVSNSHCAAILIFLGADLCVRVASNNKEIMPLHCQKTEGKGVILKTLFNLLYL